MFALSNSYAIACFTGLNVGGIAGRSPMLYAVGRYLKSATAVAGLKFLGPETENSLEIFLDIFNKCVPTYCFKLNRSLYYFLCRARFAESYFIDTILFDGFIFAIDGA